jgi:hypothetical protein
VIIQHENKVHQAAAINAEMTRQGAVAAAVAAGGGSAAVAAAIKTAETAFYRSVIASCVANGIEAGGFRQGPARPHRKLGVMTAIAAYAIPARRRAAACCSRIAIVNTSNPGMLSFCSSSMKPRRRRSSTSAAFWFRRATAEQPNQQALF